MLTAGDKRCGEGLELEKFKHEKIQCPIAIFGT
jgi:hypothetical protein